MSTETYIQAKPMPALVPAEPIPLKSGDRLTHAEFHRRYLARNDIKKADLFEGVVYVVSPLRYEQHRNPYLEINLCCAVYDLHDKRRVYTCNGVQENEVFPGLWLDTQAFWKRDLVGLLATHKRGLASKDMP